MVRLGFVALRCADLEASRAFYELVGLAFVEEQHGSGPRHLSSDVAGVVVELYPAKATGDRADLATIGLTVADLAQVERRLRDAGLVTRWADGSATVVATDPDGRRVRITMAG